MLAFGASTRWRTPFINVLLVRVIPEAREYHYWSSVHGLPVNPLFASFAGRFAWDRPSTDANTVREQLATDPALADVRNWIDTRGRSGIPKDVVLRPRKYISGLSPQFARGLNASLAAYSPYAQFPQKLHNGALNRLFFMEVRWPLLYAVVLALALCVLKSMGREMLFESFWIVGFLFAGAYSQGFITYYGDSAETERHMAIAGLIYRTAGLIGAAAVLGEIVAVYYRRAAAQQRKEETH